MKWFSYIVGLLLLVIDQLVKSAVSNQIALGTVKSFIPGVLSLTNLRNDGAAWSILDRKSVV